MPTPGSSATGQSHEQLTQAATPLPPGSGGILATDFFNGCRAPLMDGRLSGSLIGLTLGTTPGQIYRAVVEATAFEPAGSSIPCRARRPDPQIHRLRRPAPQKPAGRPDLCRRPGSPHPRRRRKPRCRPGLGHSGGPGRRPTENRLPQHRLSDLCHGPPGRCRHLSPQPPSRKTTSSSTSTTSS